MRKTKTTVMALLLVLGLSSVGISTPTIEAHGIWDYRCGTTFCKCVQYHYNWWGPTCHMYGPSY